MKVKFTELRCKSYKLEGKSVMGYEEHIIEADNIKQAWNKLRKNKFAGACRKEILSS